MPYSWVLVSPHSAKSVWEGQLLGLSPSSRDPRAGLGQRLGGLAWQVSRLRAGQGLLLSLFFLLCISLSLVIESWELRTVLSPWKGLDHSVSALLAVCQLPCSLLEPGNQREEKILRHSKRVLAFSPSRALSCDSLDYLLGIVATPRAARSQALERGWRDVPDAFLGPVAMGRLLCELPHCPPFTGLYCPNQLCSRAARLT